MARLTVLKIKSDNDVVSRSTSDGKVEFVPVTVEEKVGRQKFLRSASLKAVPKKTHISKSKAQLAVKKYFKDHAHEG